MTATLFHCRWALDALVKGPDDADSFALDAGNGFGPPLEGARCQRWLGDAEHRRHLLHYGQRYQRAESPMLASLCATAARRRAATAGMWLGVIIFLAWQSG